MGTAVEDRTSVAVAGDTQQRDSAATGFMAVTLYGVGRAVSKDPELFQAMRGRSARFGRSLQMVAAALDRTEIDVLRAYVNTLNPAMWLNGAGRARRPARVKALRELARLTERLDQL